MYCSGCGKQIKDGIRFCPFCGKSVSGRAAASGSAPSDQSVTAPVRRTQRSAAAAGRNQDKAAPYDGYRNVQSANLPPRGIKETGTTFALFFFRFWIRGSIVVNQQRIRVTTANTLGRFIPAGKDDQTIPIGQVSSARVNTSYDGKAIALGIVLFLIGAVLSSTGDSDGGLGTFVVLLFVFGILKVLSGVKTILTIERAGSDYQLSVPGYDKGKILKIRDVIDEALVYEESRHDVTQNTDRIIEAFSRMQYGG